MGRGLLYLLFKLCFNLTPLTQVKSMESFNINVELREKTGKAANNRYRQSGKIPAVIYQRGQDSLFGAVDYKDFTLLAKKASTSTVFLLKSGDKNIDGRSALVKEIQKDFISQKVLHVDFQALRDDEEIIVQIPIRVVGESLGVKNDGGILAISAHNISVSCLPKSIPHHITVDVTPLELGESIHAEKLELPEGVSLAGDPEETIVSIVIPRAVAEETPATAAAEAGAAAAPAAGAAAAPAAAGGDKKAAAPEKKK